MAKSIDSAKSGSNQPGGPEFLAFVNRLSKIEEEGDIYRAKKKKARRDGKAEGFILGEVDAVMKMTDWGRDEVRESFKIRAQYASWMKLPVGSQASLLDDVETEEVKDEETAEDLVYHKGFQAGVMGKSPECPEMYHDQNQDWSKGWKDGQGSLAKTMMGDKK